MATLTEVLHALDTRATTEDGSVFRIVFNEFNDAERELAFSETEAALSTSELQVLASERYNALRLSALSEHGWTEGIGGELAEVNDE